MYFGKIQGKPVIGLEETAKSYYNKSVKSLSENQFISLLAMIVMPSTFHIIDHPKWNEDRTSRIKALMNGEYKPVGLMDQFYGELPHELAQLVNLRTLLLGNNGFKGNYVTLKRQLPNIVDFDLDDANTKGSLVTLDSEDDN